MACFEILLGLSGDGNGWVLRNNPGLGLSTAAQRLLVLVAALSGLVLDPVKHVFVGVLGVALAALSVMETGSLLFLEVAIPAMKVDLVV